MLLLFLRALGFLVPRVTHREEPIGRNPSGPEAFTTWDRASPPFVIDKVGRGSSTGQGR